MSTLPTHAPSGRGLESEALATLAAGSRSFRLASRFLPAGRRADAAIVYAFCRRVDDAVDEAASPDDARSAIAALRGVVDGEQTPDPVLAAFAAIAARRRIVRDAAHCLIDGVASDLESVRVPDDRALLRYCHGVASTVGLLMCGVLGVDDERALPFAVDLGVAMQLTNICRDVGEDAAMGRVYLPEERLRAAGTSGGALLGSSALRPSVALVVRDLLALAERYYRSADEGMRYIPWRSRLAIVVASRVYRRIGVKLARRGHDALAGRTVVGALEKTWVVAQALVAFAWIALRGLAAPRAHEAAQHADLRGLPGTHAPGTTALEPDLGLAPARARG